MNRPLVAFALVVCTALPAVAETGIALVPQTAGTRVPFRVVRSVQTTTGPQISTSTFSLVKRIRATVVLERTGPNGTPNLSILKAGADGSLSIADTSNGAASDGELADVLYAINLATAVTHDGDPAARGTWFATMPLAPAPNATTAPLVLVPGTVTNTGFDFSGVIQTTMDVPSARPLDPGSRGVQLPRVEGVQLPAVGGRRRRGGEGPGDGTGPPIAPGGIAVTVHVDGHAADGRATRVNVTETRSVSVGNAPFVNVESWAITVLK